MLKKPLVYLFIVFIFFSCDNIKTNQIENEVFNDIANSSIAIERGVIPIDLDLRKVSNGNYLGVLYTEEENGYFEYNIKVTVSGEYFQWEILDDGEAEQTYEPEEVEAIPESKSKEQDPCNMSDEALLKFLTENRFSLNGNGNVMFLRNYSYSENKYVPTTVTITGGRATLRGEYSVSYGSVSIRELRAIDGVFDATRNNGSSGSFSVDCNGDLSGSLYAGRDSRSVNITFEGR